MSARQRGQEVQLRFTIDGQPQRDGSWLKVQDWTLTPDEDIIKDDFLGETESDPDFHHHGYGVKFSILNVDEKALQFMQDIASRDHDRLAFPKITMTVLHAYREPGATDQNQSFDNVILKVDEHASGGRKERTKTTFSGFAKRQSLLAA